MSKAWIVAFPLLVFPGSSFGQVKPASPPPNAAPAPVAPPPAKPATPPPAPAKPAPSKPAPSRAKPASPSVKPNLPPDAKQTAAAMEVADELQRSKKFDQARAVYQGIIAAQPDSEAAAVARFGIAQSYMAQGKTALAEPFLESVSADEAGASPRLREQARNALAGARLSIAEGLAKAGKEAAATAMLRKTVDDKRSSPADVRAALLAIARHHLQAHQTAQAAADFRLLLTKPPVGESERLDDIIALAGLAPSAVKDIEAYIKGHALIKPADLARARVAAGEAYAQLKEPAQAAAAFDAVLAIRDVPFESARKARLGKANLAIAAGDPKAAAAIYRDLLLQKVDSATYNDYERFNDIEELIRLAPGTDVTAEIAAYLDSLATPGALHVSSVVPNDDALWLATAPSVADAVAHYAQHLREATGRATPEQIVQATSQLAAGGKLRLFVATSFSKELAKQIAGNTPSQKFLKLFLDGDYRPAARLAWRQARLVRQFGPQHERTRDDWIRAVVFAVRADDQCWAGRSAAFLEWLNPAASPSPATKGATAKGAKTVAAKPAAEDETPNPLSDYLDLGTLPFEAAPSDIARAVAYLNGLTDIAAFNQDGQISRVVPGNDVITLATDGPNEAYRQYRDYLWRTTGRATTKQLAAVQAGFTHPGTTKSLVTSEQSKHLAETISDKAPQGAYLKRLLRGDYQGAARIAWGTARAAKRNAVYDNAINQIALAIRCRDRAVGGRDVAFVEWTQGTLKGPDGKPVNANPEAAFLGGQSNETH